MSFQWYFKINPEKFSSDDLICYQKILREIKMNFEDFDTLGINISFYENDDEAPADNIFATFQYACNQHFEFQEECAWYLLWNPFVEINKDKLCGRFHMCAPSEFKKLSNEILNSLKEHLPHCVEFVYKDNRFTNDENSDDNDDDKLFLDSNENNFGLLNYNRKETDGLFELCDIDCGDCLECNLGISSIPDHEYFY